MNKNNIVFLFIAIEKFYEKMQETQTIVSLLIYIKR